MKQRACDACGRTYVAQRSTSRFCGGTCKKRGQRGADVIPLQPDSEHPLVATTRRELADVDRLDCPLGQAALSLACRIAVGKETGAAVAALSREFRATLEDALKGAAAPQSAVVRLRDELAARRRA